MIMADADRWYCDAFGEDYLRVYQHRGVDEAVDAVPRLVALSGLSPGARCLDLCCGFGRHLNALLRCGLDAVGLDLSPALLARSVETGRLCGKVIRGDMRAIPLRSGCLDGVFSLFTSFGYFDDDAGNGRVVREVGRVLAPGGRVVIDFLNPIRVRRELRPVDRSERDGLVVKQERWIDAANNTVNKVLTISDGGGTRSYRERVKLYGPDAFGEFFAAAGLRMSGIFGSADGDSYDRDSHRLVVIGTRR